ncbi:hypothetical protein H310_06748 [Aphanomyces invadans]|uniref:ACT domain-containing protein n=1 Tax=Aphanomyces invadans TaxID=157072 RepID=A0A024U5G6_9STRA|nr:hypothetical protein H310_06748 [Aphanomyces invadans]ETW01142.1 hypothetical protein H310_06748 [Aphanomyces invadans]|eukprot:XP_008870140.1 hypothetical protein H310_06748 [Aphanomyces invadans]
MAEFVVHKFGGTSVGSATAIKAVQNIVANVTNDRIAVVVSAMGGKPKVTDLLISLVELAKTRQQDVISSIIDSILCKHDEAMAALLPHDVAAPILDSIRADLKTLEDLLRAISIMRSYNENVTELVSGHGELWSARILTAVLNQHMIQNGKTERFAFVDAREVLVVEPDDNHGPVVQYDETKQRLSAHMDKLGNHTHLVITGFICSTTDGVVTTLKRDGSDFSASIFGRVLNAAAITIWTDVSGVYSADPRRVPEAQILPHVSYQEAMELAYFGAKVIHPKTMAPAISQSIPIFIRNTFDAAHPGTRIYHRRALTRSMSGSLAEAKTIVSGFSTVDDMALFNLEGSGMVGVHGVASRLFSALDRIKVNVVLIAQASSEHSICFAIPAIHAPDAKEAIEAAFFKELHHDLIDEVTFVAPATIIAAVGDNMSETPGVCARFFGALGRAKINVLAISQGSSERNISAVVRYEDSGAALRAVHAAFFMADHAVSVGVLSSPVSTAVGLALQSQLFGQSRNLVDRFNVDLRLCAMASITTPEFVDVRSHATGFDAASLANCAVVSTPTTEFHQRIQVEHIPHSVIVDLSNDLAMLAQYPTWLAANCHIVSANLHVANMPSSWQQRVAAIQSLNKVTLDLNASLGMAVPVLSTIQNLLQTGDAVERVESSWSSLFNAVVAKLQSSSSPDDSHVDAVLKQYAGLSPQDMVEDLTGLRATKKMVLVARELGLNEDVNAAKMASPFLMPPSNAWKSWTVADVKAYILSQVGALRPFLVQGSNTRLVTTLNADAGGISTAVQSLATPHPFAGLMADQCALAFYTSRHQPHPLVIGGSSFVSDESQSLLASTVFGSVLKLARSL